MIAERQNQQLHSFSNFKFILNYESSSSSWETLVRVYYLIYIKIQTETIQKTKGIGKTVKWPLYEEVLANSR